MDFHKMNSLVCDHSNNTPLLYYYDDNWDVRGSKIWYKDNDGRVLEGELTVCLSCGYVFVKRPDNDIK